jgi:putative tricarboxylic transport membrane protein
MQTESNIDPPWSILQNKLYAENLRHDWSKFACMPIKKTILPNLKASCSPLGHPDRISGGLLIIVACIAIYEASHLPFGSLRKPDAGFFPLSLSTLLLIFAVGIVLNSFVAKPRRMEFNPRSWYVLIGALAFIIYALSMAKVGFVVATTIIMLIFMRGLGGMSWVRALLIAVPSVVCSYFAFVQLGVPLPRGPLPF